MLIEVTVFSEICFEAVDAALLAAQLPSFAPSDLAFDAATLDCLGLTLLAGVN